MKNLKWNGSNPNRYLFSAMRRKSVAAKFLKLPGLFWNKSHTIPEHISSVNLSVMISKLLNIRIQKSMALIHNSLIWVLQLQHQRCMVSASMWNFIPKSLHYYSLKTSQQGLEYTYFMQKSDIKNQNDSYLWVGKFKTWSCNLYLMLRPWKCNDLQKFTLLSLGALLQAHKKSNCCY